MNFSALNTHAIGVQQLVTASAVVEGAGSFSAAAGASAQVTLHSHAIAVSITSVAVATTQSVIRFAAATATMGCNAAANTEGYRVQFSNAEIVCTASSDANAVVQKQAVVYVTAEATNVAVGSRVAYTSASLQAECNLTANSGRVAFAQSTIDASAALFASTSGITAVECHVAASSNVATSTYTISDAKGFFTGSSVAISIGEKKAVAHTTLLATAAMSSSANVYRNTQTYISASATTFSSIFLAVPAAANITSSCSIAAASLREVSIQGDIAASSQVALSTYVLRDASGEFNGSSLAISVGNKKAVTQTTLNGTASIIADAGLVNDVSLTIAAQAELAVTASVFKFVATSENEPGTQLFVVTAANGNYYINGVANAALDLKYGFTYTFDISDNSLLPHPLLISTTSDGSHNGGSAYEGELLGKDFSYSGTSGTAGSAITFTLSNTVATNLYYYCLYHSGMGGSITSTQSNAGIAYATANPGTTSFNIAVISGAAAVALAPINVATCTSNIVASAVITASSSSNVFVSAAISGNAVSISIGNKISVTTANSTTANAEVTANAVSLHNSEAVVTAAAITTASAGYIVEAVADISDTSYVVPGYWIPEYDTYTYTTTTATIGAYSPVPSFRSVTDYGGTPHYFTGVYWDQYNLYQGANYDWTFSSNGSNSTAPTEQSTWGSNGSVVGSLGSGSGTNSSGENFTTGRYKGAQFGNNSHQQFVNIGGMGTVTVTHYVTSHRILEDTVTTHTTTHPAVWVGPVTVQTGYGPDAAVSTAYIDVWLGVVSSVAGSANVATVAHLEIPASGLITASASVSSTSLILGQINATAALNASAEVVTDCIRFVGARGDFLGSNVTISVGENVSFATASIYSEALVAATSVVAIPVNALINAGSDVSGAVYITNNLTAAISATASLSGISKVNKAVLALAGFEASGAVTSNAGVIQNDTATISASASITAIGGKLVSVTADVSDTGYWTPSYNSAEAYTIPAYDTWVDSLAAAYWVKFDNSQIQIGHVFESIAPYNANTTYNGSNIPTTIRNTLNSAAPAGTTYYTQLTQARTRSGVSGFDGAFKRRLTTTHPAVYVPAVVVDGYWTVTGLGPTSNTTATAEVMHGALFSAAANVEGSIYLESTTTLNIEASTAITATNYVDVYVDGAFTGSNVTITAGEILIFASGAIEASATITAEADRSVIAKAFIEGNAVFTSQGVGLNVSEARVTASAAVAVEVTVLRYVAVPLNIDATVIITTRFVLLAQEGQRSNGILILVEPENRALAIEVKKERVIYAKAA
jgi:hypothetical protein